MLRLLLALTLAPTWDDAGTLLPSGQFNLVCTGTLTSGKLGQWGTERQSPFTRVYRVDLGRNRWCTDDCTSTASLVEVTPDRIVFEREERAELSDKVTYVSRESSAYVSRDRSGFVGSEVFVVSAAGTCKPARFTGFPVPKF